MKNTDIIDRSCKNGKTALITGGSSGIGFELAKQFASSGYDLLLVAKPEDELKDSRRILKGLYPDASIFIMAIDLSEEGAANDVHSFSSRVCSEVSVLVNCAGFGTYGFIENIDPDREHNMLKLNVLALYDLTRLYLKDMLKHDRGHIINISSIAAFQPNPYFSTYGASKSFILQFSRSLMYELQDHGSNVRVLAVCPTAVKRTGFQKAAGMEHTRSFSSWMATTPEVVARETYCAMQKNKEMIIPGRGLNFLQMIVGRLPVRWLERLSASQLKECSGDLGTGD